MPLPSQPTPKFAVNQRVRHVRYGLATVVRVVESMELKSLKPGGQTTWTTVGYNIEPDGEMYAVAVLESDLEAVE